ncbi:MAG TPA: chlorite dismutase family protein [Acidimicrobiales bacterium]|nr:chlorite dismutase family protein [Acidimicrobiales bacterium]
MTLEPVVPSVGWGVLHLFAKATPRLDPEAMVAAVKATEAADHQVVTAAMLGHKADLAFMGLGPDWRELRRLQSRLQDAGLEIADSYVSLTEVSEYAGGVPEEMKQQRLYPRLPPPGKPAFCFYPMSRRREVQQNWYTAPYEEREAMMREHGASGRAFAGRILQVITGSSGVDDYEWGVTLFGVHPDDLKAVVYQLRYDRASAIYADFGPFYAGIVTPVEQLARA